MDSCPIVARLSREAGGVMDDTMIVDCGWTFECEVSLPHGQSLLEQVHGIMLKHLGTEIVTIPPERCMVTRGPYSVHVVLQLSNDEAKQCRLAGFAGVAFADPSLEICPVPMPT